MRARRTLLAVYWVWLAAGCSVAAPDPESAGGPAPAPGDAVDAPLGRSPGYVRLARVEGYGNPRTGELWMRSVPLPTLGSPGEVGVSGQALVQTPGYCPLDVQSDGVVNSNPNGSFEFYTQYDATGAMADQASFDATTCWNRLDPGLKDAAHLAIFQSSEGVGCARQHVGNFSGKNFDRVLLDVDVFNGDLAKHGPYGPPFTDGTVVTPRGRNAPYQDLGLWDFGPMPSGSQGVTSGPHLMEMWIYFKNGDPTDFNWTGFLLGEIYETCGNGMDDDCDGVADNGCGTLADGMPCYADADCVTNHCEGASVTSGIGAGGGSLGGDVAGTCSASKPRISAGQAHTCRLLSGEPSAPGGKAQCWGDNSAQQASAPGATNFVDLASGADHTCALDSDTYVTCWGGNAFGQLSVPGGSGYVQVASGSHFSCGLRDDATVQCWGDNSKGQTAQPTNPVFVAVSTGAGHACALRYSGAIQCWGDDTAGQATPPGQTVYTQLSAGQAHTCALQASGKIDCWGDDSKGQSSAPAGTNFVSVAAGGSHSCAVKNDGTAVCWGDDSMGQATPAPRNDFESLSLGDVHSCAVRSDGSTDCWGSNASGQLAAAVPVALPNPRTLASGERHSCAIVDDGSVRCWGSNALGGMGGFSDLPVAENAPPMELGGTPARSLAAGSGHTCALLQDDSLRCWGDNAYWQAAGDAGADVTAHIVPPAPLALGARPIDVVAGQYHTCALRFDGSVICFGDNSHGQLGQGTSNSPVGLASAVVVDLGEPASQLCARSEGTCALGTSGEVYCWGAGAFGQNGLGNTADVGLSGTVASWGPVSVLTGAETSAGRKITRVDCGGEIACAILDDGNARCWGRNVDGELGYGHLTDIGDDEVPSSEGYIAVTGPVAEISTGERVSCARLLSGEVQCWGQTTDAACLGHQYCGTPYQPTPQTPVIDLRDGRTAIHLAARSHSATVCAVLNDQGVKCWGANGSGDDRCGIGTGGLFVDPPSATYTLDPPPPPIPASPSTLVLGQADFSTFASDASPTALNTPTNVAIDGADNRVYVADSGNNRVVRYADGSMLTNGAAIEIAFGQTTTSANSGGTGTGEMNGPEGVCLDNGRRLWVADTLNHRVLRFDDAFGQTMPTTPDAVLGTGSPGVGLNQFNHPTAVFADDKGALWVADTYNHRVMRFDNAASRTMGDSADGVLGQTGVNGFGLNQLDGPRGVFVDGEKRLWVADTNNHRVMHFDDAGGKANGAPAEGYLGTGTGGSTLNGMGLPGGVAGTLEGYIFVSDQLGNRVMIFEPNQALVTSANASYVLGQPDLATTTPGQGDSKLQSPAGLFFLPTGPGDGVLLVADRANHRVLLFEQP